MAFDFKNFDPTNVPKLSKTNVKFDPLKPGATYDPQAVTSEYNPTLGADAVNTSLDKLGLKKFDRDSYLAALDNAVVSKARLQRDVEEANAADAVAARKISGGAGYAARLLARGDAARTAALGKAANMQSAEDLASRERATLLDATKGYADAAENFRQNALQLGQQDRQFGFQGLEEQRQFDITTEDGRKQYIAQLEQMQKDAELQRKLGQNASKTALIGAGTNLAAAYIGATADTGKKAAGGGVR